MYLPNPFSTPRVSHGPTREVNGSRHVILRDRPRRISRRTVASSLCASTGWQLVWECRQMSQVVLTLLSCRPRDPRARLGQVRSWAPNRRFLRSCEPSTQGSPVLSQENVEIVRRSHRRVRTGGDRRGACRRRPNAEWIRSGSGGALRHLSRACEVDCGSSGPSGTPGELRGARLTERSTPGGWVFDRGHSRARAGRKDVEARLVLGRERID